MVDIDDETPDLFQTSRGAERVKVDAFVKVVGADREYVFRTRDLSKDGLFLYTKVAHAYPFKPGSRLDLELYDLQLDRGADQSDGDQVPGDRSIAQ